MATSKPVNDCRVKTGQPTCCPGLGSFASAALLSMRIQFAYRTEPRIVLVFDGRSSHNQPGLVKRKLAMLESNPPGRTNEGAHQNDEQSGSRSIAIPRRDGYNQTLRAFLVHLILECSAPVSGVEGPSRRRHGSRCPGSHRKEIVPQPQTTIYSDLQFQITSP